MLIGVKNLMDRSTVCKLKSIAFDTTGVKAVPSIVERQVFCELISVSREEFYKAYQAGFKPTMTVSMFDGDYNGELCLELDGVNYDIYRTYRTRKEKIELYCVKKVGNIINVASLYVDNKIIKLYGIYLSGQTGTHEATTGKTSSDDVVLVIPPDAIAYNGKTLCAFKKPKAYKTLINKQAFYTIDSDSFWVMGDIDTNGKYQDINGLYDDCYKVRQVNYANSGRMDTDVIEVVGR